MSDEKKEITPVILEVYKEKTVINVDVPVEYITRFNQLLLEFVPFKDEQHLIETMKKVADGDQSDPFSYHVTTILSFLNLTEESARTQGHLKKVEFNPETKEQKDI